MPIGFVEWICGKCGTTSDIAYREGAPIKLRDAFVEAYHSSEAAEHELAFFCEKCNDIVGHARVPTGSDAFVYLGDIVFVYRMNSESEESEVEPPAAGDTNGEGESAEETG